MLGAEQAHTDNHIDWRHNVAFGKELSDYALDPPEHRIDVEVVDRDAHCPPIPVLLRRQCGHRTRWTSVLQLAVWVLRWPPIYPQRIAPSSTADHLDQSRTGRPPTKLP